jgi:hypothetical protein
MHLCKVSRWEGRRLGLEEIGVGDGQIELLGRLIWKFKSAMANYEQGARSGAIGQLIAGIFGFRKRHRT